MYFEYGIFTAINLDTLCCIAELLPVNSALFF